MMRLPLVLILAYHMKAVFLCKSMQDRALRRDLSRVFSSQKHNSKIII